MEFCGRKTEHMSFEGEWEENEGTHWEWLFWYNDKWYPSGVDAYLCGKGMLDSSSGWICRDCALKNGLLW